MLCKLYDSKNISNKQIYFIISKFTQFPLCTNEIFQVQLICNSLKKFFFSCNSLKKSFFSTCNSFATHFFAVQLICNSFFRRATHLQLIFWTCNSFATHCNSFQWFPPRWKEMWDDSLTSSILFDFGVHSAKSMEFTLPRKLWCNINRLRTEHGRCNDMLYKWNRQCQLPMCPPSTNYVTFINGLFDL